MGDEEFTPLDALAWLGITEEAWNESWEILRGRHGNPLMAAVLDARKVHQGTETWTPEQILAQHGIDPADPLAAARAYDKAQTRFDA